MVVVLLLFCCGGSGSGAAVVVLVVVVVVDVDVVVCRYCGTVLVVLVVGWKFTCGGVCY